MTYKTDELRNSMRKKLGKNKTNDFKYHKEHNAQKFVIFLFKK